VSYFNSASPDGNANYGCLTAAGFDSFQVSLRTGCDSWPEIDMHIDWAISCRLMQSTIVKPLVCGSSDTNTAQNHRFPWTELPCWFQPGIPSIAEMLEDKYMVYNVYDMLEESPRYSHCWLPSNRHSISTPDKVPLF